MDHTTELLSKVIETARSGKDATEQLIGRTLDTDMVDELVTQRDEYLAIERDAMSMISDKDAPKEQSPMAKTGMKMGITMNTMADKSPSHIADMVIQGATMGVIDLTGARNEYVNADAEAQGVASYFIERQQATVERMKKFLRDT